MDDLTPASEPGHDEAADPTAVMRALAHSHARFLAFLERRVGTRADAEDILQAAFVRGIQRAGSLRKAESATAWFYRLLRNALSDHYRRRGAERRALASVAAEATALEPADDAELLRTVCGCVRDLAGTLKPEYATALRRVELEGASLAAFAAEAGITPGNAGVRLHRARRALRRQLERSCGSCATHGCRDCDCEGAPRRA
jgi:RNA polymerase sigma-70 factor (ECF subfamily)